VFNSDELAVLYEALKDFGAAGNFDYDNKPLCSSIENAREKLESIPEVDIEKYLKIKVLIIEPGQDPRPAEIINDLYTFQDLVGGYIDVTHPDQDGRVAVVFNEEGRLHGLSSNREINGNMYVGTLIVAGCDEKGEFCSLDAIQSEIYKQIFKSINMSGLEKQQVMADMSFR
jgi:hypothetical protein